MWQDSRDFLSGLVAALRADLHNTSARQFKRTFEPADFLEATIDAVEDRAAELVAAGMNPAAAAAIASSRQTKEEQIGAINSIKGSGPSKGRKGKPAGKRG